MTPPDLEPTTAATLAEVLEGGRGVFLGSAVHGPDLAAAGWTQVELVAEGVARSYTHDGELPGDGRFELHPGPTAPFRTRVLVRRPAEAADFAGTVVVEWLNVSGGLDANPDYVFLADELVRRGMAWVGVSAQYFGVVGGAVAVRASGGEGIAGLGLTHVDPARYGTLDHPGDAFAYDIYTQVGRALRAGVASALGPLEVEHLLAVGESQSAFALTTYVNGVHPLTGVYDGFLVHSRGRAALPLGVAGTGATASESIGGPATLLRTDHDTPVVVLETETDLMPVLGYAESRQDDAPHLRLWEVAGTAHADATILGPLASTVDCGVPINEGPQRFAVRAALRALDAWVRTGRPAPAAPRLELDEVDGVATIRRDADGIALGGIRFPHVEAPVATLSGEPGPVDSLMCALLGSTLAFDPERLATRYPSTEHYLAAYERATDAVIDAGFALPEDRDEILADARPEVIPT